MAIRILILDVCITDLDSVYILYYYNDSISHFNLEISSDASRWHANRNSLH